MLLKLLPDLENRLERIHPNLLYQLVDDVDNVGLGLVSAFNLKLKSIENAQFA